MMYKVMEIGSGTEIDGPTGAINVHLEPTDYEGEVHIKAPGDGIGDSHCRIEGNTYQHKDLIKKLPYGNDGAEWTGEVWAASSDMTSDLAAVLSIAAVGVTINAEAVASDEEWGGLIDEVDGIGDDDEEETVMVGPSGPGEGVSRSWAEQAAETANYDTVDEFIEHFEVSVVSDDVMADIVEQQDDSSGADTFSSE